MRRFSVPVLTLLIQLFVLGPVADGQSLPGDQPPAVAVSERGERFAPARQQGVPNRYIVILEDQFRSAARPSGAKGPSVPEVASDIARLHAATPLRTWALALLGFLVELPEEEARALSRDPRVRLVEQDAYVQLQNVTEDCGLQTNPITGSTSFPTSPQIIQCADPQPAGTGCFDNWGLDRIDEGLLPKRADGLSDRDGFYNFDLATAGVTVHAYLLDTGITAGHHEFQDAAGSSRIGEGVNVSVLLLDPQRGNVEDTNTSGHGTHVAGILGGMTYGVAKDVRIHPVRISTSGADITISAVVDGIDWILANRPAGQPAVASVSANGPAFVSQATALAATRLVQSGVTFVQAAGNQNQPAANVSMVGPGFPQEIIIAGGMDERDGRWIRSTADPSYSSYCRPAECATTQKYCDCGSNYGPAVDIWAPASHIVSSSRLGNDALCWLSGTSMAAPHVAGTAALLLGRFPNASPSAVEKAIKSNGTVGALTDSQIAPSERLLHSRFPVTGGPVAGDDRFFTSPGSAVDATFAALLAGDFDWDRDPLSIVVPFGTPSSGQIQVLSDRVRYTPAAGFTGEDTFSYTITDGHGNNDTALVRIRVESPLLPPLAVDDYAYVAPGNQVDQPNAELLANDSSRNGHGLSFKEIVRNPLHGVLGFPLSGQRVYTPNPGFIGTDTYVYRIFEQETLLTADATVHLTVGVSLTSTPSPATATPGTTITWTATAHGLDPASTLYALFRRKVGTPTPTWIPALASPKWQKSNVLKWSPTAADVGTWEIVLWVKDDNTPPSLNTYGYAAYTNPGPVQIVDPPTFTCPVSPPLATPGTAITWTVNTRGGTPPIQYALFRRRAGMPPWIPDLASPAWQTSNILSWTPGPGDLGAWEFQIWARDANTPPTMNTYGYAWSCTPGSVPVVAPPTVTGTGSPAAAYSGNPLSWTAMGSGGTGAGRQYGLFRRKAGAPSWIPDVTSPAWQTSNVLGWTPSSSDTGTWEIIIWFKDANTPANANTYGFGAYYNPGPVQIFAPPTLTGTGSPAAVNYGTTINWTATATGGTGSPRQYALFRRRAGATSWTPDVTSPAWQTSNVLSWAPTSSDVGTWEIIVWVRDGDTPPSMSTYGFAAYYNPGPVQVTAPVLQSHAPIGWVDGYDRQHIWGWACDPDYPMESNRVDFWSTSGQGLGSTGAYHPSDAAISSACGGGWAHYFDFYHYGSIAPGTHFSVWSIDLPYATAGNDNRMLGGNGSIGNGTEFVIP